MKIKQSKAGLSEHRCAASRPACHWNRGIAVGWVQVDRINRSVAARIAGAFTQWKQLDTKRQDLIKQELTRILEVEGVSENLYEVASKSL